MAPARDATSSVDEASTPPPVQFYFNLYPSRVLDQIRL
jgi:hypothetical protein